MPRKPYRFRCCPDCGEIFPSGKLIMLGSGSYWGSAGQAPRKCPECGYVGETNEFAITSPQSVEEGRLEI